MFSRAFCIAFALGVISVASGLVREPRSAYEVALKCTKAGWNADVSALRKDGSPDLLGDACIYLRVRSVVNSLQPMGFGFQCSTVPAIHPTVTVKHRLGWVYVVFKLELPSSRGIIFVNL